MASNCQENDDIFDSVVMIEERTHREGFEEGLKAGKEAGYQDGYSLGHQQGASVGSEIGFYKGFASMWKTILEEKETNKKEKKLKAVDVLLQLADAFPLTDPQEVTLQEQMQKIRAKFKQLASLLNISPSYGLASMELSF